MNPSLNRTRLQWEPWKYSMAEMTADRLIEKLTQLGATIRPKAERLSLSFPEAQRREVEALRPELESLKPQIIAALSNTQTAPAQPDQRQGDAQDASLDVQRCSEEWPNTRCYACNGYLFWHSIHGPIRCVTCHPPAAEHLVASWLWAYGERKGRSQ
jgi:hypothetical protein